MFYMIFYLFVNFQEGDRVKSFDRICEVQSDKATVEITSRYDGVILKVHHSEGSIVKVGAALVDIETSSTQSNSTKLTNPPSDAPLPASSHSKSAAKVDISSEIVHHNEGDKVHATPAVRKIAKENSIDLSKVVPSGPKNRVTKEDVLSFIQSGGGRMPGRAYPPTYSKPHTPQPSTTSSTPHTQTHHISSNSSHEGAKSHNQTAVQYSATDQKVPIRGMQRMMVKSMTAALQVQHLTYCEEVIFDAMRSLRHDLKHSFKESGVKLSFMPLMIKATSLALLQYPIMNASVNSDVTEMTYHANHNVGIAMDTSRGLLVPVLKQVQNKSILEIAYELNQLQEAAISGTITEAQLTGGTISLSNIGSIGGTYAVPVIVVPQVSIAAFGRLQVVPRYFNKNTGKPATIEQVEQ